MNLAPKTCKISKGTTLKELANFFKLTEEQLKRYHNTYCPLDDLIGYDIPNHVTIIYVPPEDKELREKIFNPNGGNFINYKNNDTLDNRKSYNKRYGIIQKTFHNDEEKLKIHYETEIKKTNTNIEITRHPVYVNHQRPDLIVEQIADKVGNILYPLQLGLNENGSIKEIVNFKAIQDRWKELKPNLEDYYKGEVVGNLFQRIEKQLKNKRQTFDKIADSIFYLMYFFPLYETFDDEKKYTFQMEIPFIAGKGKVLFEIVLSMNEEISKTQKLLVKAKGRCIDNRTPKEIENGKFVPQNVPNNDNTTAKGYFDFTYKLNSKDNSIFAIYGEMGIQLSNFDKKITVECYEQS